MNPIHTLLLPTLSLASTALGQVGAPPTDDITTRGPLSAMPLAISLSKVLGTGTDDLRFKDTGDQSTAPAAKLIKPASNATPDYRLSVMFKNLPPAVLANVDIDAFSSGNDDIIYDATGRFLGDALGGWATLVAVVAPGAAGSGDGPVSERVANGKDVGADVYSYAANNSVAIDDGIIGKPMLEIPREAVSLPDGTDIQAIDLFLPMIAASNGTTDALFQNTTEFYFSLTSVSAAALTPFYGLAVDGATILKITWTPGNSSTVGAWSVPTIVRTSSDMGLTPIDDIDALAMATVNTPNTFSGIPMVVSTVPTAAQPNRNQILALVGQNTPTPSLVPLHGGSGGGGGPITGGIKLIGTDNVTGLAGMDPDYRKFSKRIGSPIEPALATPPSLYPDPSVSLTPHGTRPLGLSVVQSMVRGGNAYQSTMTVQVTGWGIPGVANQSAGMVYFLLATDPTHVVSQLTYLTAMPRGASQNTMTLNMTIPAGVVGNLGLIALFVPNNGSTRTWSPMSMLKF